MVDHHDRDGPARIRSDGEPDDSEVQAAPGGEDAMRSSRPTPAAPDVDGSARELPMRPPSPETPQRSCVGAIAIGLVALVLVAGCADSSRPAPTPEARPMGPENPSRPPTPQTWLDRVCTALLPAVRTQAPAPPIDPADPVGTRDRWAAFLTERAQVLTRTADEINAAGPAPVTGGQQVTEPAVTLLRGRAEQATRAVGELEAVPANAGGTLLQTVQESQSRFPLVGPSASLRDLALTPELTRVAPEVASCREASPPP